MFLQVTIFMNALINFSGSFLPIQLDCTCTVILKVIYLWSSKEQANYSPQAKLVPLPVYVNKVVLGHSPPVYLHNVYPCFLSAAAELSSCGIKL